MARITVKGGPGPQLCSRPGGKRELRAHGGESQTIKPTEHLLGLKVLRGDLLFGREFGGEQ